MYAKRDYHYDLPPAQIAQTPAERRDGSRLLRVDGEQLADRCFDEIIELLPADAAVVFNDTRVLPARLSACKPTGGQVELLLLEPSERSDRYWRCLARSSKPLREGAELTLGDGVAVRVVQGRAHDGTVVVEFPGDSHAVIERFGEIPLPPYIERPNGTIEADAARYQTVYARVPGAVAAPTAGLHFTEALLERLAARGASLAYVTLHVGWGTFAPIRTDDLDEHVMHAERYTVPAATAALLAGDRPIVAVGTTVVRALESFAADPAAAAGTMRSTSLFIRPGYRFRAVDHLITNFHLPESTLLMLVCAFAGYQRVMAAYRHAVAAGYRFFSYGDAMLLTRAQETPA